MNATLSYFYGNTPKTYTVEIDRAQGDRLLQVYTQQKVSDQNPAFQNLQVLQSPNATALRVSTDLTRQELSDYTTVPKAYIVESVDRDKKFPLITIRKEFIKQSNTFSSPRVKSL